MKKIIFLFFCAAAMACAYHVAASQAPLITYQAEIEPGDTLWDVCRKIASDKDNLSEVVWRAARENNISDAGSLQPGQIVTVRVKQVKED